MRSRVAGLVPLAIALMLVSLGTAIGPDEPGTAHRSPPPAPPSIGTCGNTEGGWLVAVSCTEPHMVEVTYAWRNRETVRRDDRRIPSFSTCRQSVRDYVGGPPADDPEAHPVNAWVLPLRYTQAVLSGPGDELYPAWSWRVCVVRPIALRWGFQYVGTVRDDDAWGNRPPELRPCYDHGDGGPGDLEVVACTAAHTGEVVGSNLSIDPTGRRDRAKAGCLASARRLMGTLDPTVGGALVVRVVPGVDDPPQPFSADTGVYYGRPDGSSWLLCTVEVAASDARLTDTVAGVGGGPLPLG